MANLWYKNAIVYCVDVKSFMDANGDGTGAYTGAVRAAVEEMAGLLREHQQKLSQHGPHTAQNRCLGTRMHLREHVVDENVSSIAQGSSRPS